MSFLQLDCNRQPHLPASDVILVNQFFHHVEDLEGFCASLRNALDARGTLLTCDIIGRNGHQPWPDVDREVQRDWQSLPAGKRRDRHSGRCETRYRSVNHAAYSNEGVRAQDIVACLMEAFDFEVFFTFGGAIMPFVERRIGFNFDPESPEDRDFIDRVDGRDRIALQEARYPPSNMVAALRHKHSGQRALHYPITPQQYLSAVEEQKRKLRDR